ncbi:MAG: ABC transporter permease, partial [Gemmatimonadaceae bacterium]
MRNFTLALRTLSRTPFVTTVAALSLGLGIGANAAIYSIFYRIMLEELHVNEPERLVSFSAPGPKNGSTSCGQAGSCDMVFSYPMFRDLEKARPASLSALVAHRDVGANISYQRQAYSSGGLLVSGSYFSTLAIQPALGRLLTPADDATLDGSPVVVLSHRFWETRLGSDSSVLGKTLMVNGRPQTIVGVAPRGFDGITYGDRPDFFAPLAMAPSISPTYYGRVEDRRAYWLYAFGRLAPGATMDQAKLAVNAIYRPIINDVEVPLQRNMRDSMLAQFRLKEVLVTEGRRGQSDMADGARGPIFMLFAITGLVLLIACANIANLLLARATNREMEMAVRLSLGATRRQLLTQLLTESVTLAFIGGLASLLFASWTLKGIAALMPPDVVFELMLSLNWAAVGFAGVLALATGIAFGLFPALHSTRPDLVSAMRNNSGKLAGGRTARRFRTSLATAQMALAMALLTTSGLFLKSLWKVKHVEVGLSVDKLVTFALSPGESGYDTVRARALFNRVEEDLAALPGATGATTTQVPLVAGNNWNQWISVEGFKPPADTRMIASYNAVGAGHFATIGVPLLAGREFTTADAEGRPKVAIVNEAFVRQFGLGANPVGKRMAQRAGDTVTLDMEIVGLVKDFKYAQVKRDVPAVFYIPHRQAPRVEEMNFYVRTDGDLGAILRTIPAVVRRLDPMLPVEDLKTMPDEIRWNTFEDQMFSTLSSAFALLATLLASIGLYGVLAYSVAQRTREIGVRMALGADAAKVRGLVLRQVAFMVAIGGAIGLAGAIALGKVASSMLFE